MINPKPKRCFVKMSAVKNVVVVDESKVVKSTKGGRGRKPKADTAPAPADVESKSVVQADVVGKPKVGRAKKVTATTTETAVVVEEVDASNDKKPRKPSLPAKFGKFIQFGLFLLGELNDDKLLAGEEPALDKDYMIEKLCVFADVDAQVAFVQKFFDAAKDTAKTMRKMIADKKKADKKDAMPKKDRKPRVKKDKDVTDGQDDSLNLATKPKHKGKAKATKEPDLVAELVTLANQGDDSKPKRKYTKKPKTLADTLPPPDADADAGAEPTHANTDPDPELEVDIVVLDGIQFLCDDQNRLFDFHSHLPCGFLRDGNLIPL